MNQVIVPRLQAYLRTKAHTEGREAIFVPPFTVFMNPSASHPYEGVAVPDEYNPIMGYAVEDVRRMCAAFMRGGRVPYVQFLDAFAPGLPVTLQLGVYPHPLTPVNDNGQYDPLALEAQAGKITRFNEVARLAVMACTPGTLIHPPDVPGLSYGIASSESPLDEIKEGWEVNSRGFDPEPIQATDTIAEQFRKTLVTSRAFTGKLYGMPVAAGMFTEIRDGVTELAGITTLVDYRRQGIGAALTAYMTRAAFDSGVDVVFLIAANAEAGRVYERIGFRAMANLLEFEVEQGENS
jgi:GNAT superfamily N-acetyltransferase